MQTQFYEQSRYNKPDRIFNGSFYEFYQKMVEDFVSANKIFIIGYSFNDLHINAALRRAMKKGVAKIVVVDKCSLEDFSLKYSKVASRNSDYCMLELIEAPNTYRMTTNAPLANAYLKGLENFILEYK